MVSMGVVASEKGDPPAALAQHEAECDQPEVVALTWRAREQRQRPGAHPPVATQGQHPAAEDTGREVLLGH